MRAPRPGSRRSSPRHVITRIGLVWIVVLSAVATTVAGEVLLPGVAGATPNPACAVDAASISTTPTGADPLTRWVPAGGTIRVRIEGGASQASYTAGTWRLGAILRSEVSGPGGTQNGTMGFFQYYPDGPAYHTFSGSNVYNISVAGYYDATGWLTNYYGANDLEFEVTTEVKDAGGNIVSGLGPDCLAFSEFFGPSQSLRYDCPCNGTAGKPVNTWSGNEHLALPGLSVPGRGPGLGVEVAHNSLGGGDVGVGEKWRHSYAMDLAENGDGSWTVTQETGATVTFYPDGSGGFVAPPRHVATLTDNTDGTWTMVRNHFEVFTFDESTGHLLSVADLNGNEITLDYSGGVLDTVTDEAGRTLTFSWVSGRIDQIEDDRPGGEGGPRVMAFDYDGNGDLVLFTDVEGNDWKLVYDGSHRWTRLYRPEGAAEFAVDSNTTRYVENHYDGQGRVDWQDDELNRRTQFLYDTPNVGDTTVVFPDGDKRIDTYEDGRRTRVRWRTSAGATVNDVHYDYDVDTLGVEEMYVGQESHDKWEYDYDAAGNRIKTTDPLGRETDVAYNSFDQPVTVTDNADVVTTFVYDGVGNLLEVIEADGTAEEVSTVYVHGDGSHPEDVTSVIDTRNKTWSFSYDADTGYRESAIDPEGNTTQWAYTYAGWVDTITAPKGMLTPLDPDDFVTSFTYNDYGIVLTSTNPENETTTYTYDANSNIDTVEDNDSELTSYVYDDADQLVEVERPDTTSLLYSYYDDGLLEWWRDGNGDAWTTTYDAYGRVKTETDPNANTTAYTWDEDGNLATVRQPGGDCLGADTHDCISYSYDDAGQLVGIDYADPDTPDVPSITYDPVGRRNVLTVATFPATTQDWNWDLRGRLTSYTDTLGKTTSYDWDPASNLLELTYPGQTTPVTYDYDDAGRMISVEDWLSNTTTFNPDEHGNYDTITFPTDTGNVDQFSFDDADRMITATWNQDSSPLGSIDYESRDAEGLVDSATIAGLPGSSETYTFDDLDRLTGRNTDTADYDDAGNLIERLDGTTQGFDPAQQLCWSSPAGGTGTCTTPPGDATTYTYDDRGNRTSAVADNGDTLSYRYDAANRLTTSRDADDGDGSGQYHPVTPARIMATSTPAGSCFNVSSGASITCDKFTAGETVELQVAGVGGVPADAAAVVLTVTAVGANGAGYVNVYPAGMTPPSTTTLTYDNSSIRANTTTVKVGDDGRIAVYTVRAVDVYVDVLGWYTPPDDDEGAEYIPLNPDRAIDTRYGIGDCPTSACSTLTASTAKSVQIGGEAGIPTIGVDAVNVSITVTGSTGAGYLVVYETGTTKPNTSNVNFTSGQTVTTQVTVPVSALGRFDVWSNRAIDIIVDVSGYYTTPTAGTTQYVAANPPVRGLDTRYGTGTCESPGCTTLTTGAERTISIAGLYDIPDTVTAVAVTVTSTGSTAGGYFTLYQPGTARPEVAQLAYASGQTIAASTVVPVDHAGRIQLYAHTGADAIIDITGYFTTPGTTYTYDGDGLRATKTTNDTTTEYTWTQAGGLPLLLQQDDGTSITNLIYGPGGMPIAEITGTDIAWYHHDHLGSTRLVTDNDGDPLGTYTYDPYGTLTNSTGTFDPLLDYAGQYTDNETGLQYLRARYYDPETSQFLTRDPLVGTTLEPYAYASNDPVNATDPTGLCPEGQVKRGSACYTIRVSGNPGPGQGAPPRPTSPARPAPTSGNCTNNVCEEVHELIGLASNVPPLDGGNASEYLGFVATQHLTSLIRLPTVFTVLASALDLLLTGFDHTADYSSKVGFAGRDPNYCNVDYNGIPSYPRVKG